MIGDDKEIGRGEIDQRTDIKTVNKIADNANKVRDQCEQDELVEPDGFPASRHGIIRSKSGIDDVLVKGLEYLDKIVAQRCGF